MKQSKNLAVLLTVLGLLCMLCACSSIEKPTESLNTGTDVPTETSEISAPNETNTENDATEEESFANPLFRCGLVPVCSNEKWGYVDKSGTYVINPQFDWAAPFSEDGLACVSIAGKYGCIDTTGAYVINPQFDKSFSFENGLAVVMLMEEEIIETIHSNEDGDYKEYNVRFKYGYIDKMGAYVVKPQFGQASPFDKNGFAIVGVGEYLEGPYTDMDGGTYGGLASVNNNCKYGVIDRTGTFVVPAQFDDIGTFNENGLTCVRIGKDWSGKYGYIDKTGAYVINPQFDCAEDFGDNGLAMVSVNFINYGYIDQTGAYVCNPLFDYAGNFGDNGLARVCLGDRWGYINETGAYVINPQFDHAEDFGNNGLAVVGMGDYWDRKLGYIDQTGTYVINPQYDDAVNFGDNGLARVRLGNRWGYIDGTGAYAINPQFDYAEDFGDNGLARVFFDGRYGYINEKGTYVVNPQYPYLDDKFSGGLCAFENENGQLGYVDSTGKEVIPAQFDRGGFDEKRFYDDGYAVAEVGSYKGVIDQTGKWVINPQFEGIHSQYNYW